MPIQYSLTPHALSGKANQYRAVVQRAGVVDEAQIVERMVARRSGLTRGEVLAVLEVHKEVCLEALAAGERLVFLG